MGVPVQQVETAIKLNEAGATTYTDLAVFTRGVLVAGEKAAPETMKPWWRDSITALDENVDKYAQSNRDLLRLISSMQEIDPALRLEMYDRIADLIIIAKTGTKAGE
jgi:hypothetical protein